MVVTDGDSKTDERLLNYNNLAGHLTKISVTFCMTRVPIPAIKFIDRLECGCCQFRFFADGFKAVHLDCFVCLVKKFF